MIMPLSWWNGRLLGPLHIGVVSNGGDWMRSKRKVQLIHLLYSYSLGYRRPPKTEAGSEIRRVGGNI